MEAAGEANQAKGTQPMSRAAHANQKPASSEGTAIVTRFFLAKAETNGSGPTLDRELATEAEAILESLKTGRNYYSVVEWRAVADCTGKAPQLRKEPVSNKR